MDSFLTELGQPQQKDPLDTLRPKPVPRKRPPLKQRCRDRSSTVGPTVNVDTVVQSRCIFSHQGKNAQPLEDAQSIKVLQTFN